MKLYELKENSEAVVRDLKGDSRFIGRIISIGLTPGCRVRVLKNDKNRPMLLYSRDTMISLGRSECMGIEVEKVTSPAGEVLKSLKAGTGSPDVKSGAEKEV